MSGEIELTLGQWVVREYNVKKEAYRRFLNEHPTAIYHPRFTEKKKFKVSEGEDFLFGFKKVECSLWAKGMMIDSKNKGMKKHETDPGPRIMEKKIVREGGLSNCWTVIFTNHRILAFIEGDHIQSSPLSAAVESILRRNTMITVQLPLHWVEQIDLVKRVQFMKEERKPIRIKISLRTLWGSYTLFIKGKGLVKFNRTDSMEERFRDFAKRISKSKKYLVQFLIKNGTITEEEGVEDEARYFEEYHQEPEEDDRYEDVYYADIFHFTPYPSDHPWYLPDLESGLTRITSIQYEPAEISSEVEVIEQVSMGEENGIR